MKSVLLLTLLLIPPATAAKELGRLFFTPAERQQLEQRQLHQVRDSEHQTSDEAGQPASVITVNGMIQRADGSRIVWINGKAQMLPPGNTIPVTVPGRKQPLQVKIGQHVVIDTPPVTTAPAMNGEDDD